MATVAAAIAPPRKRHKEFFMEYFVYEADEHGVIINPQKHHVNNATMVFRPREEILPI